MKLKVLLALAILIATCAACNTVHEPTYPPILNENDVVRFEFSQTISEYGDINLGADGYYHFPLDRHEGQVPRHIYSEITVNNSPFERALDALHGGTVEWQSNLEWLLTDSVVYIIRRRCPYDDDVVCMYNMNDWIPADTIVVDYFEGMTVPTVNSNSYPNGSEVGTVIAPLAEMIGDTMIVNVKGNFEGRIVASAIRIILE